MKTLTFHHGLKVRLRFMGSPARILTRLYDILLKLGLVLDGGRTPKINPDPQQLL